MASGPIVFDRAALRRNLRRAEKLGPATFLIDRAAEDLCDRLSAVLRRFELAVDLASPTDAVRRRLRGTDLVSNIIAVTGPANAAEAELEHGASPHVAPFADVRAIGMLLQRAGFALPVTDVERLGVRYQSPFALMQDLRRMGATNALAERRRTPLRRGTLMRMAEIYAERFSDPDGRVRATFDIVWLSGWKPHASQQQPLAPGSARTRLADALGTQEIPAGDKAGR